MPVVKLPVPVGADPSASTPMKCPVVYMFLSHVDLCRLADKINIFAEHRRKGPRLLRNCISQDQTIQLLQLVLGFQQNSLHRVQIIRQMKNIQFLKTGLKQGTVSAIEASQQSRLLKNGALTLEFLLLMGLVLKPTFGRIPETQRLFELMNQESTPSQTVPWLYSSVALLALLLLIANAAVPSRKHKDTLKSLFSLSYLSLHLMMIPFLSSASVIISSSHSLAYYFLFFGLLPLNATLLHIQPELHILGVSSIFLVVAQPFLSRQSWVVLFILALVHNLWRTTSFPQIVANVSLLLTHFWVLCHSSSSKLASLATLGVILLIVTPLISVFQEQLKRPSDEDFLLGLIQKHRSRLSEKYLPLELKDKMGVVRLVQDLIESGRDDFDGLERSILDNQVQEKDVFSLLQAIAEEKEDCWLLAEIELLRGKNLLRIFNSIGEVKASGLPEILRLEGFKKRAQKISQRAVNQVIDLRYVQEVNAEIERFYQKLYRSSQHLILFWRAAGEHSFKTDLLNQTMETAMAFLDQARDCLKRIEEFQPCKKEKEVLEYYEQLMNPYSQEQEKEQLHFGEGAEDKADFNYVIFNKSEILNVSSKLILELQLQVKRSQEMQHEELFQVRVLRVLLSNLEAYERQFYLPFLIEGRMLVYLASIHILPSYFSKTQYIVVLRKKTEGTFFLYDITNETTLNHSTEAGSLLKSSVNLQLSPSTIGWLLRQKSIDVDIGRDSEERCRVALMLKSQYRDESNNIILVELLKYELDKYHEKTIKLYRTTEKVLGFGSRQKDLMDENTTFCKISNPLAGEIAEKLEHSSKSSVVSHACCVAILFTLIILLLVSLFIGLHQLSVDRHAAYHQYLLQGSNLNKEYQAIMSMFYDAYFRYFTFTYPEEALMWRPLNVTQIVEFYAESINAQIVSVTYQQFMNPFQSEKPLINYTYFYDLYNVSANSRDKEIFNLLQEFKRYLRSQNITFMVRNYDSIRSLEKAYRISSLVTGKAAEFSQKTLLIMMGVLALVSILVVSIYVVIFRAKATFLKIYGYFADVTPDEQKYILKKIKKLLQFQPMLRHQDVLNGNKNLLLTDTALGAASDKPSRRKLVQTENFGRTVSRNIIYLFFLALLALEIGLYQSQVASEVDVFEHIINYLEKMQASSDFVLTQMTDGLNAAAWREIYNTTNFFSSRESIDLQTHFDSRDLPPAFNLFISSKLPVLYGDLCIYKDLLKDISYFSGMECEKVFYGALQKGFAVASESYRTGCELLMNINFKEILRYKNNLHHDYPVALQDAYFRRIILPLIDSLNLEFISIAQTFFQQLSRQVGRSMVVVYVGMVALVGLVGASMRLFKVRCRVVLGILKAVPKTTLLHIRYAKKILKTNFLGSIDRL